MTAKASSIRNRGSGHRLNLDFAARNTAAQRQANLRRRSGPLLLVIATALTACQSPQPEPAPVTVSIATLYQRPAERALIQALRLYEEGVFDRAEQAFKGALQGGLRDPRDIAVAYKYLAFIACAFNRINECEQGFRAAFASDAEFKLTDAEIGHPIWGPAFKRVVASLPPPPPSPPRRLENPPPPVR